MNNKLRILLLIFTTFIFHFAFAANSLPAITRPIPITEIPEFSTYPLVVQQLILKALNLSQLNLTYLYGSADPNNKGMDCSGTMYYLLHQEKVQDAPRSSDEMFSWVEKKGKLYRTTSRDINSPEFSNMQPGDLLFWSGTYKVPRDSQITHVMLYLGKNKKGEPLMFGASDGRTYQGKKMWGVSVFDFKLPDGKGSPHFVGYSCIPNLTCKKHPI